jgi:hypothetical protein
MVKTVPLRSVRLPPPIRSHRHADLPYHCSPRMISFGRKSAEASYHQGAKQVRQCELPSRSPRYRPLPCEEFQTYLPAHQIFDHVDERKLDRLGRSGFQAPAHHPACRQQAPSRGSCSASLSQSGPSGFVLRPSRSPQPEAIECLLRGHSGNYCALILNKDPAWKAANI